MSKSAGEYSETREIGLRRSVGAVGLVLYVLSSVTGSSVQSVTRGTVPFLIPLLITLLLITFVPAFSLWLPGLLVK